MRGTPTASPPVAPPPAWRATVLALGDCRLGQFSIDHTCAAAVTYGTRRVALASASPDKRRRVERGLRALALEQLGSPRPSLRHWAVGVLTPAIHRDERVLPKLLAQANREKHAVVLVSLVRGVRTAWRRGAPYGKLVISAASHPAAGVRRAAMPGLGEMVGHKQALKLLIQRMQRDPDPGVRTSACRHAGGQGAEELVPIYGRLLAAPKTPPGLRTACLLGLMELWNPLRPRRRLSRRAYALMLRGLRRLPAAVVPGQRLLFQGLGRAPRQLTSKGPRTPSWYRKAAVVQRLSAVAGQPAWNRFARGEAVSSLGRLGARKALESLQSRLKSGTDADTRYVLSLVRRRLSTP